MNLRQTLAEDREKTLQWWYLYCKQGWRDNRRDGQKAGSSLGSRLLFAWPKIFAMKPNWIIHQEIDQLPFSEIGTDIYWRLIESLTKQPKSAAKPYTLYTTNSLGERVKTLSYLA